MLIKKFQMVMLAVLTVSSIACTRVIPVKLNLPDRPSYFTDISPGVRTIEDRAGNVIHFIVEVEAMKKLAKNRALCREDNKVLRQIILTTH